MNYSIKTILKNIKNKTDLEKNLADYANLLSTKYNQYSMFAFSMNYFVFHQLYEEELKDNIDNELKKCIDEFNQIIKKGMLDDFDGQTRQDCIVKLDEVRCELIERMDILADYASKLLVYEYVIFRERYKIEHKEDVDFSEDTAVEEIVDFILGTDDKTMVAERMKSVIVQLPMRMTRNKFFELINNALTLFKDSNKADLEGYLYKLRSASCLYKPNNEDKYYANLSKEVEKINNFDYDNITEDNLGNLINDFENLSKQVKETSDAIVGLQDVLNKAYAFMLTRPYVLADIISQKENEVCMDIIKTVNESYFDDSEYDEEAFDKNAIKFEAIEGCQERYALDCSKLESELDVIKDEYESQIESMMLAKQFECLVNSELLLSSSSFVKFDDKKDIDSKVTDSDIKEAYIKLEAEFKDLFKNSSKKVRRAIMSNVTYELPMIFKSKQEIYDYIKYTFDSCRDIHEKKACYIAINEIMSEFLY